MLALICARKLDNLKAMAYESSICFVPYFPLHIFSDARSAMPEVSDLTNSSKQKLVSDMKVVVSDAEEILRATAGVAGEKMADLRERIGERLRDAKLRIADAEAVLVDTTKAAARAADDYVNDNPWQAVGIAAGIGFLVGVIIGRR
jgi:ElaB/YqjD/DUF883 family membrane-anchored ribosome-binding protein